MIEFSVIIPHKRTRENDAALKLAMDSILRCYSSCEILIDTQTPADPYTIWNEYARTAKGKVLIFTNSDVVFAPGWDVLFGRYAEVNTIVTGYLVEPGNIPVADVNIQENFGLTPSTFNVRDFSLYAIKQMERTPTVLTQRAWYMPCAINREWFLYTGGFDTTKPFPHPNDTEYWDRCVKEYSTQLLRVNSWAYHFQNLSGR